MIFPWLAGLICCFALSSSFGKLVSWCQSEWAGLSFASAAAALQLSDQCSEIEQAFGGFAPQLLISRAYCTNFTQADPFNVV